MYPLRFSPSWFIGIDLLFELLVVIVTAFIAIYAYRFYKFSQNYRYKYLGLSFAALAVSFLAKISTNFVIYFPQPIRDSMGTHMVSKVTHYSMSLFEAGFIVHRFLFLIGLFGIYWLVSKSRDRDHIGIFVYLLFLITLFSVVTQIVSLQSHFIFYLTAAMLLYYIVRQHYSLCLKSKKKASINVHLNFVAYLLVFFSQLMFIISVFSLPIYAVAEGLQLLGFVIFLVNIMMLVFGYGKKKNKN